MHGFGTRGFVRFLRGREYPSPYWKHGAFKMSQAKRIYMHLYIIQWMAKTHTHIRVLIWGCPKEGALRVIAMTTFLSKVSRNTWKRTVRSFSPALSLLGSILWQRTKTLASKSFLFVTEIHVRYLKKKCEDSFTRAAQSPGGSPFIIPRSTWVQSLGISLSPSSYPWTFGVILKRIFFSLKSVIKISRKSWAIKHMPYICKSVFDK